MTTEYPEGMTIAELKALIKDWPDDDSKGEPSRVVISDSNGRINNVTECRYSLARIGNVFLIHEN